MSARMGCKDCNEPATLRCSMPGCNYYFCDEHSNAHFDSHCNVHPKIPCHIYSLSPSDIAIDKAWEENSDRK